jgi:hypothetical protein
MTKSDDYLIRAVLSQIRAAGERETLESLHRAIEMEIGKRDKSVSRALKSGNRDFADAITDEECGRVEELLGLAFVAAQSFITAIRTRWTTVYPVCRDNYAINFSFDIGEKGFGLLKESPILPAGSQYHAVEVVNAVANYWKHVEEWPTVLEKKGKRLKAVWDLATMRGNEKRTAEIAMTLRMSTGSSGNLRQAAEGFGVTQYSDLSAIRKVLFDWSECLYKKAETEIHTEA